MKTIDFCNAHKACADGRVWALSVSEDMADVWDAMIEQGKYDWLFWTVGRPGVFEDRIVRLLICRIVRETPLADGRTVWDLLTDERSRNAVVVAERFASGEATIDELAAALDGARDAGDAAWAARDALVAAWAARVAAWAARVAAGDAWVAAGDAAWVAAGDAAMAAQILMVKDLGNPFRVN